jgi:SAM-dependent methyltransferase
VQLNKVCNLEDWPLDGRAETMRRILPYFLSAHPEFPAGMEHRKHWEFAQVLLGLDQLGVLGEESMVCSVAAGHEEVAYELTNHVRWVFASDIYGTGPFTEWESDGTMLRDPDAFARIPYNRRRLVVQYMDALDLRFEDGTFDAVYSLSSIEHFGGGEGVRRALAEQCRVVKVGGVVAFTTEVIVNGAGPYDEGHLLLSTPEQIEELCGELPGLRPVEPIDFSVSGSTLAKVKPLAEAIEDARRGVADYPHIVVEHEGRRFTSVAVFLERTA